MRRATQFQIAATLAVALTPVVQAQNWPSFRGPGGAGVGTGDPPTEWNVETGQNVRWSTPIAGLGHSAPIVWDKRVFVTTAISSAAESPELKTGWLGGSGESAADSGEWTWKLICLDRDTGKTLWERDATRGVPEFKRHAKASHANCTPATDGEHVVAFFASEGLYCYSVDGELLWKKDLGPLNSGPYDAPDLQWGFASSPIIHDGKVIVQCDAVNTGFWAAFDTKTGGELRRVERKDVSTWSTPAVITHEGRAQLVCNGFKQMSGYDLETGRRLWWLSGGGDVPVPTPQIMGDLILLTNGHGRSPIYAIHADARGNVTPSEDSEPPGLAWSRPTGGSYMPTPLVYDGLLYVGNDNGVLTVLDAATGAERYRERLGGGGNYSASPVAAGGKIYFTSEDGDVTVVRAGPKFERIATNAMNAVCMATPAISDGRLFIRTRDRLYCIAK